MLFGRAFGVFPAVLAIACGETLAFNSLVPLPDVVVDQGGQERDADAEPPPPDAPPIDTQPESAPDVPVSRCQFDSGTIAPEAGTGPASYWPLDESPVPGAAFDAVGGVSGAEIGAIRTTSGRVGLAYRFDGQSYIRFADVLDQDSRSFSVHLWYRAVAAGVAGQTLLSKGATGAGTPPLSGFLLRLRGGVLEWAVNDSGAFRVAATPEPPRNDWHQVVAVLDRAHCELKLYVDGEIAVTEAFESLGSVETNVRFSIGALDRAPGSPSVGEYLVGELDEVALYVRALDSAEVGELHARGLSGEPLVR